MTSNTENLTNTIGGAEDVHTPPDDLIQTAEHMKAPSEAQSVEDPSMNHISSTIDGEEDVYKAPDDLSEAIDEADGREELSALADASEKNGTSDTENPISEIIGAAEEVYTALDDLMERTAIDPGAPFESDAVEELSILQRENPARFEALRFGLKKLGVRVTVIDSKIAALDAGDFDQENGGGHLTHGGGDCRGGTRGEGQGLKQADILVALAAEAELFHTPDKIGYADVMIHGHRETWPVRSRGFRRWLTRRFFEEEEGAPNSEALKSALSVIEAKADFDSPERLVHVRVGEFDGKIYLDLCNQQWQAVEIDADGWRVVDSPPARFRRAAGMLPLPAPVAGGSVDELSEFVNVKSSDDFVLLVAYLLATLRPRGPYPVMTLAGEQGSAKTTFSQVVKGLVDPNSASRRSLPREDRDLFISAHNGHVLAFDNISALPTWTSDTICRLSTGGSFATRTLYTDDDEILFEATRPIILNGIEDFVTRPDLGDRALFLTLEPIPEERRRAETELWAAFEAVRPRILGALLDAVAKGVAMLPQTKLATLPRMADFALWVTACETALWSAGTFADAYDANRDQAVEGVLESDQVAVALRSLMVNLNRPEWKGTATRLLGELSCQLSERQKNSKEWPLSAKILSGRLRRVAPLLRKIHLMVDFDREGKDGTRTIRISRRPETGAI